MDAIGFVVPFLGIGNTALKLGAEKIGIDETIRKNFEKTQKIMKDDNFNEKKAISFLAKINPVARLNVYN